MSFYDSASLVFLPSGGAGKDGKAYSMKPVPEYGSELVTNGDFATDSDWIKGTGWTISGGTANCDGTQTPNTLLYQNIGHSSNTLYRLQFTISNYVSGTIDFALDNPFFGAANSNGTFVFDITPSSVGNFIVRADENFVGSIDNVSVKEITTSGDFTFSRGSNLTATRVDSNGLIEKGRENLLLQSNQFDTTWTRSASDLTSGQSGYDGSSDAWLLTAATPSSFSSRLNQVLSPSSSGVLNLSVYAKANTLDWILLDGLGTNGFAAWFDVSNGVKGQVTSTSIGANITSVGNGWYRCEVYGNATTLTEVRIYVTDGDGTTTANDGDGCYIQDAQLEIGLVATEYIESGATTGKAGLLEDSPRFDYSGGASCPSLLLEPSRTNYVGSSEYIANWQLIGSITATANYGISPEGLQNSTRLVFTGASQEVRNLATSATGCVASIYVKGTSGETIKFGSSGSEEVFTLNGSWQRIDKYNAGSPTNITINTYSGATARDIEVWGAQVEQGSYPTSYIPNHSGGSVTRAKEKCNVNNVTGEIGQTQGTIFLDADLYKKTDTEFYIAISDGTLSNSIYLHQSAQSLLVNKRISGVTQFLQIIPANWSSGRNKCAITYTATEMKIFVNGVLKDTETINGLPSGLSKLTLGSRQDNLGELASDSNFKQAVLFPTVLSNTDLEILTGTSYESFAAMATALNYTTYE